MLYRYGFYIHPLFLVDGKAFAWGYSEKGRLGCIDKSDCEQKKRILTPRDIHALSGNTLAQMFAGHYHSLAIATNGKLWGWGENVDYVLGPTDDDYEEVNNKPSHNSLTTGNKVNKKRKQKVIYYKPIELKVNKNLVRITGGIPDIFEAYFQFAGKLSSKINISEKGQNQKTSLWRFSYLSPDSKRRSLCLGLWRNRTAWFKRNKNCTKSYESRIWR